MSIHPVLNISFSRSKIYAIFKLSLKKYFFQEGDEGEREGVVGSGNPFGDDDEEEVGSIAVTS